MLPPLLANQPGPHRARRTNTPWWLHVRWRPSRGRDRRIRGGKRCERRPTMQLSVWQQIITHVGQLTNGRLMLLSQNISMAMMTDTTKYKLRMQKDANHPLPKMSLTGQMSASSSPLPLVIQDCLHGSLETRIFPPDQSSSSLDPSPGLGSLPGAVENSCGRVMNQ